MFEHKSALLIMEFSFLFFVKDVELESADAKKQSRGSTSAKRSRAAEVHNLSERVCTRTEVKIC